jgi:hypothetical protein
MIHSTPASRDRQTPRQPDPEVVIAICQCLRAYGEPLSLAHINRIVFHNMAELNQLHSMLLDLVIVDRLLNLTNCAYSLTSTGDDIATGIALYLPERKPLTRPPAPDYTQRLALFQELIRIEHWLRHQAELATGDSRLAARLDRGADQVEQAANRVKGRLEGLA